MASFYLPILSRRHILFLVFLVSTAFISDVLTNRISDSSFTIEITDFVFTCSTQLKRNVIYLHPIELLCWEGKYCSFFGEIPKDTHWEDITVKRSPILTTGLWKFPTTHWEVPIIEY